MPIENTNEACKTQFFKDIISDLLYSFRISVKNLTEKNIDITLNKIRLAPIVIPTDSIVIEGKIKNLVGGSISCVLELQFVNFLESNIIFDNIYEPSNLGSTSEELIRFFISSFFDNFSSVSKNCILDLYFNKIIDNSKWETNTYYIQYVFKIVGLNTIFKLNIAVDELTSIYFKDN